MGTSTSGSTRDAGIGRTSAAPRGPHGWAAIALSALACWPAATAAQQADASGPPRVALAADGQAALDVVVAAAAPVPVRTHAQTLADYLSRISAGRFRVVNGDGRRGIAIGLATDFPSLDLDRKTLPSGAFDGDGYLLRSHADGLLILGATPVGVSHGVWDVLHRLGHRHYMIGDAWEIVPARPDLALAVDRITVPDYRIRDLTRGARWVHWALTPATEAWVARNRLDNSTRLFFRHIYGRIIAENREIFDAHPAYLALYKGERQGTKFCIANPGLRRLVVDWALAWFKSNPAANSLPMEPSDGGGWCACADCAAMGSVTDRVITLANQVAEAVADRPRPAYITLYAYNLHGAPPTVRVHPNVVVYVATSWLRGRTPEQLLLRWQRQGARWLGTYEYPDAFSRTRNLPARARIASPAYLRQTLATWHRHGAMFHYGNASYSVGANGLGLYLAARILWDGTEADRIDALIDDFLANAFGPARAPMRRFFKALETDLEDAERDISDYKFSYRDDVAAQRLGLMFTALREAMALADSDAIRARLHQLLLYARYVELNADVLMGAAPASQAAVDRLGAFVYRIRSLPIVSAYRFFHEVDGWGDPAPRLGADAILAGDERFAPQELDAMLDAGARRWAVAD